MAFATATTDSWYVVPLSTFTFIHQFQCLTEHHGRIVEHVGGASVQYKQGVPFQVAKILDDARRPRYISKAGWIFHGTELHDLWVSKKLRIL